MRIPFLNKKSTISNEKIKIITKKLSSKKVESIILYGSQISGKVSKDSDIDILVVIKEIDEKTIKDLIKNKIELEKTPFNKIGLHGLIFKEDGKKISKYDNQITLINDINSHIDNVRLSLLKQSFGLDFKSPNFDDEEKFRRKIENCINFFLNCPVFDNNKENKLQQEKIIKEGEKISNEIRNLNFSGAYQNFKCFIYNRISSQVIPSIQSSGISQEELNKLTIEFTKISKIFAPITTKEKLSK